MECEAKYLLEKPHEDVDAILDSLDRAGLEIGCDRECLQVDRYYDTPNWKLLGKGWAFRIRTRPSGGGYLTLKSLGDRDKALHRRQEIEQSFDGMTESASEIPPGEVKDQLERLANGGIEQLQELFQVHTRRRRFALRAGETELELCLDDVGLESERGGKTQPVGYREMEVELVRGQEVVLERLATRIEKELRLLPARQSKFGRGLALSKLPLPSSDVSDQGAKIVGQDGLDVLAHQWLKTHYQALIDHEDRAWEGVDPEGVHQMRVASRRLRVGLSVFGPCLPTKKSKRLAAEIKWITKSLGRVRDLDVHRMAFSDSSMAGLKGTSEFQVYLEQNWQEARGQLIEVLASRRYRVFKKKFEAFLRKASNNLDRARSSPTVARHAKRKVGRAVAGLLSRGRGITKRSPDRSVHQLRICGKELRYLLEIFAPIFPKRMASVVKESRRLQDYLGEFQDAHVMVEEIEVFERTYGKRLKALRKIHSERQKRLRKAFPRHWARFDKRVKRADI